MADRLAMRVKRRRRERVAAIEAEVKKHGLSKVVRTAGGPTDPTFYLSEFRKLMVAGPSNETPYKWHVWVYRSARAIVNALVSVDFALYAGSDEAKVQVVDGRWYLLFLKPNPMLKRREMWELTALLYMLEGECFWILESATGLPLDKHEVPVEIWPVSGKFMKPEFDPQTGMLSGWEYRPPSLSTKPRKLKLHEVVFHRNLDPASPGYLRGMSFLSAATRGVTLDALATEWNESLLKNGAEPGGLLTTEQALEPGQREDMMDSWDDTHGGPRNAGKIALMEGGVKYQPLTISPKDMMYLSQLGWGREQVAAAFGVPLWFLGVSADLNFATAKSAERILWTNAVLPLLRVFGDNLEADLFEGRHTMINPTDVWGEFDTSNVEALRGDEVEKINVGMGLLSMGYPIDEVNERQNLGMKPQPLGDVGLVGMGTAPREMVAAGELAGGGIDFLDYEDEEEDDDVAKDDDSDDATEDGEPDEPVEEEYDDEGG